MGGNSYNVINKIGYHFQQIVPDLAKGFRKIKSCKIYVQKILEQFPDDDYLQKSAKSESGKQRVAMGLKYALTGTDTTKVTSNLIYEGPMSNAEFKKIVDSQKGKRGGIEAMLAKKNRTQWTPEEEQLLKSSTQTPIIPTRNKNAIQKKLHRENLKESQRINWKTIGPYATQLREELGDCYNINQLVYEQLQQEYPELPLTKDKVTYYFNRTKQPQNKIQKPKTIQKNPKKPKTTTTKKKTNWYKTIQDPKYGEMSIICSAYLRTQDNQSNLIEFLEKSYKIHTNHKNLRSALNNFEDKIKQNEIPHPYTIQTPAIKQIKQERFLEMMLSEECTEIPEIFLL